MGYYSQVAITLYDNDCLELLKKAREKSIDAEEAVPALKELFDYVEIYKSASCRPQKAVYTLFWSDVKWYESYDEIKFVMGFLHEKDRQFVFKRIGEEYDDIEFQYNDDKWDLFEAADIVREFSFVGKVMEHNELNVLINQGGERNG